MKSFLIAAVIPMLVAGSLCAQSTNVTIPAKVLESYVGQYELAPGFVLTIRKEGDRLTAQATGQPRIRLIAQSEVDFRVSTVDASLTFVKDKDGKVTQVVLHQNGEHEASKISSEVPKERLAVKVDPKKLAPLVGQYELGPGQIITVRRDSDKLRAQLTGQPNFQIFPESETNFFYKVVDAQVTFVKDTNGKVTELVLHQNGDHSAPKTSDEAPPLKQPDLSKIAARDPKAPPQLIDLTGKYNALLNEQWHPDADGLQSGANHLGALKTGVQKLGDVQFDIRGLIQLTGAQADAAGAAFPEAQPGIKVGRKCKKLHALQGTGWRAEDGVTIGKYVLHYADGSQAVLTIVYGVDTRDWWDSSGEPKSAKTATVVWTGSNPATEGSGASLRLFKRTYDNPKPDIEIATVDFISTQEDSAPFLIALTVED